MEVEYYNQQYARIIFYEDIHHKSDVAKIANLAYVEMALSFYKIVANNDGIQFIFDKLEIEQNGRFVRKLLGFLLPFDRLHAIEFYTINVKKKNIDFISIEPYGSIEMRRDETFLRMKEFFRKIELKSKKQK